MLPIIAVLISLIFISLLLIASTIYFYRQKGGYRKLFTKERELRKSNDEFRAGFYAAGDAVITAGPDGRILRMNRSAEKMTGWKENQAEGQLLAEVCIIRDNDKGNYTAIPSYNELPQPAKSSRRQLNRLVKTLRLSQLSRSSRQPERSRLQVPPRTSAA